MDTWIYLIRDNSTGLTKIGFSNDPRKRIKVLMAQPTLLPVPHDFTLLEAFAGNKKDESKLHERFKNQRVRGEWFDLEEEQIEWIKDEFFFYNKRLYCAHTPFDEYIDKQIMFIGYNGAENANWIDCLQESGEYL